MEGISNIVAVFKPERFSMLKEELKSVGILGMTVTRVEGCGLQGGRIERYRGQEIEIDLLPKIKVEIVVPNARVDDIVDTIQKVLHTGKMGDGKIFVYDITRIVRISSGDEGMDALDVDTNHKK